MLEDISNQPAYRQIIHRLQDELALLDAAEDQDAAAAAAAAVTAAAAASLSSGTAAAPAAIRRDAAAVANQTPQPSASLSRNYYSKSLSSR